VDFIDMASGEHRNSLFKHMQELMENDRAKHNVLPLTKFGLMQITRQRIRPATQINTAEICPLCHGTGKITSSAVIDEQIERDLADLVKDNGLKAVTLKVGPILGAYLTRGLQSYVGRWRRKYKCKVKVCESNDFTVLQYEFYNEKGEKLF
jgi:Ribonucleases G and E